MPSTSVLRRVTQAADHIAGICFKTGPPRRVGVELEWTVHRADKPQAHLDAATLRSALGPYAPAELGNPDPVTPLPHGGAVTVEPGGQVEISSAPAMSLTELHTAVSLDRAHLADLLARAGLVLGASGIDPHRPPRRMLQSPRYVAMQRTFDARGRHGRTMMCSTAGLQVCLDAGPADRVPARWATLHDVGPPLVAAFATSRWHAGRDTGWASGRMATWYGIDPHRTRPVGAPGVPSAGATGARRTDASGGPPTDASGVAGRRPGDAGYAPGDPTDVGAAAGSWAAYALDAPLLCVRRDGGRWDAPPGVTFADWIRGALPEPPTVDDLDYHLGTLFPPVRPRGYLEVRYLDAQPGDDWIAPVAVLTSLLADDAVTDAARGIAAPVRDRWVPAARHGLADPALAGAAAALLDLACRRLDRTGLPPSVRDQVTDIVERRLRGVDTAGEDPHR